MATRHSAGRWVGPEALTAFDERGFFVVPDVFDAATVAAVLAAIDPLENDYARELSLKPEVERTAKEDLGAATFAPHLVTRSPELRAFAGGPFFSEVAAALLGPDVRVYWDQAVYKKTERPRVFPWHQDNGDIRIIPEAYITCWVALSDATEENGCLWMLPGQHRAGMLPHHHGPDGLELTDVDEDDAVAVPVRAGSVVVFSSLVPHRSGPNLTSSERKAYILQYAVDGSIVPRSVEQGIPEDLRMDDPERQYLVVQGGRPVHETSDAPSTR